MIKNNWEFEAKKGHIYYESTVTFDNVLGSMQHTPREFIGKSVYAENHVDVIGNIIDSRIKPEGITLLLECHKDDFMLQKTSTLLHQEPDVELEPILTIKMYLNSSKDYTADVGAELGLSEEARKRFLYALGEVEFDVEVDTKTGATKILAVDGKKLSDEKFT